MWADALFGDPSNTIKVFEKEVPFKVVKILEEGMMALDPEFASNGKYVDVSDWKGNVVQVYDAATLEKVTEIGGVVTPPGIFKPSRRHEPVGH